MNADTNNRKHIEIRVGYAFKKEKIITPKILDFIKIDHSPISAH